MPDWTPSMGPRFHERKQTVSDHLRNSEEGKVGWIILWLLGVPLPILFLLFLVKGCD
jgi:hypothetical protein